MNAYDVIVIGAGHNGLTAAGYLGKAGKKVLVLERRPIVGGSVVTEPLGDGTADTAWAGGQLRPGIVRDLGLASFGYPEPAPAPAFTALLPDSDRLVLEADPVRAAHSIRRFSESDAQRWPGFVAFLDRASAFLDLAYSTTMPRLPRGLSLGEGYGLVELGLDLRLTGRREMMSIVRGLTMSAREFLEDWFESESLKAALASVAVHAVTAGPLSAGTGYTFIHSWLNRGGLAHRNVGRAGAFTAALAGCVRARGGEIRTDAEVARVLVDSLACRGVQLASGEEILASAVLSAVDPKRTFLSLVGPLQLPPEFVWKVQSIKMRGSVAKVHLHTDGRHGLPDGTLVLAPSIQYIERAYDAAKYGGMAEEPVLEVTTSGPTVSVHVQYAPYQSKSDTWSALRAGLEDRVVRMLGAHFPNLESSIVFRRSLLPDDLESTFGVTEGDLNHGQLLLDQFMFMRPIPGWSNHKTPVDGLFLGGSGVHGGGGVSGAAGRNAARAVLRS